MTSLTSIVYQALRLSRDVNAARRGPRAIGKRAVRKVAMRSLASVLNKVLR